METSQKTAEKFLRFSIGNQYYNLYETNGRFTMQNNFFDSLTPEQDISALIYIEAAIRAGELELAKKANDIILAKSQKIATIQSAYC